MNLEPESSMRVALGKFELHFPDCRSSADKNQILLKLKNHLFAEFKIAAHEVAHHDKWQRSQIGMALVGNDATELAAAMDQIQNGLQELDFCELIDAIVEVIIF